MKHNWTRAKTAFKILTGAVCAITTVSIIVGPSNVMAGSISNPSRGRDNYEKRCLSCHELDKAKVGPSLRGVYGRPAGKDPRFTYSDAMKKASVTWNESTLDRWLADTDSVIPGNDMDFRLSDPAERANIIAYLRQLSGK